MHVWLRKKGSKKEIMLALPLRKTSVYVSFSINQAHDTCQMMDKSSRRGTQENIVVQGMCVFCEELPYGIS